MRDQTTLAVKRAGLGIPDPTTTTRANYSASRDCSKLLVESLMTGEPINIVAHQKHATDSQKSSKEHRKAQELSRLAELKIGVDKATALQMDWACKSGAWLTVMPRFMDETELSAEEFWDNIRWRLGLKPLRLPTDCDGCGVPVSAEHVCQCKIGGAHHPPPQHPR